MGASEKHKIMLPSNSTSMPPPSVFPQGSTPGTLWAFHTRDPMSLPSGHQDGPPQSLSYLGGGVGKGCPPWVPLIFYVCYWHLPEQPGSPLLLTCFLLVPPLEPPAVSTAFLAPFLPMPGPLSAKTRSHCSNGSAQPLMEVTSTATWPARSPLQPPMPSEWLHCLQ